MPPASEEPRAARRAARRTRRAQVRRRRAVALGMLAALAAGALAAGAIIGADGGEREVAVAPPPACPPRIASDPARLAGQMLIVGMGAPATDGLRRRLRAGEIGGLVLFPPPGARPAAVGERIARLRTAARAWRPLVMIDQEGGPVERLPGLPPAVAPADLGRTAAARSAREGRSTGAALQALGIGVDLAPVLDVPAPGAFIASRAFADRPGRVARAGVAFGAGLQDAGVAATAKHFPGLGTATTDTDLAPSIVAASRAELERGLRPFRTAARAGLALVMVSNAVYPAYDGRHPASQSRRVIGGLLRERLGFEGVVITDDLLAPSIAGGGLDEAEAAVGAARAGADLVLLVSSTGDRARRALAAAQRSGRLDRGRMLASCARTTALRERFTPAPRGSARPVSR